MNPATTAVRHGDGRQAKAKRAEAVTVPEYLIKPAFMEKSLPLGKPTEYVSIYTPSLLCPISRSEGRQSLKIDQNSLPFQGVDLWTSYELSWLDPKGKPHVAVGKFYFPASSPKMVESKSFKLYLNSYNQTRFNNLNEVVTTLETDLSTTCGGPVLVHVLPINKVAQAGLSHFAAENIDALDIKVDSYKVNPRLLSADAHSVKVRESLCSDLLKTNCPVTGQPDWASVVINYYGRPIDRAGLLQYIISYREHQGFHENCVEQIFMDVLNQCKPDQLTVAARYTRRGGLDINPIRSNCGEEGFDLRLARQ